MDVILHEWPAKRDDFLLAKLYFDFQDELSVQDGTNLESDQLRHDTANTFLKSWNWKMSSPSKEVRFLSWNATLKLLNAYRIKMRNLPDETKRYEET